MSLKELVEISRRYGADTEYVIAGGGNTSLKENGILYIKGSGAPLAEMTEVGFVKMDRTQLASIWQKTYPANANDREAAVLADMLAARLPGEEHKRPSVETLLHDLLPFKVVVHLHPALVNGLTCSRNGEKCAQELFSGEHIWIPSINPGYTLALAVKDALSNNGNKAIIFLQNHGVFVGADSVTEIDALYHKIMETINGHITICPDFSPLPVPADQAGINAALAAISGNTVLFALNKGFAPLIKDRSTFTPVSSAFTPDHIVYSGSDPLFIEKPEGTIEEHIAKAWKNHSIKTGRSPHIVAVQDVGLFGIGATEKAASLALLLFTDAVKVASYAQAFGGPLFMDSDKIDFINNWEAEHYRVTR
ncbi:hypothetical protein FACS1894164_06460 [Spirochaetia bacterium]|nr:hypothetical protein FACS1894164_06460 [Spirochaetia bacterium]